MARGYSGSGERLKEAILRRWPSVGRFCIERRYQTVYVHRYVTKDHIPPHDELMRLCADLDVTPGWLLLGADANKVPTPPAQAGELARAPKRRGRAIVTKTLVGGAFALTALLGDVSTARASSDLVPRLVAPRFTSVRLIGGQPRHPSLPAGHESHFHA